MWTTLILFVPRTSVGSYKVFKHAELAAYVKSLEPEGKGGSGDGHWESDVVLQSLRVDSSFRKAFGSFYSYLFAAVFSPGEYLGEGDQRILFILIDCRQFHGLSVLWSRMLVLKWMYFYKSNQ